jgi:hypothetical protein
MARLVTDAEVLQEISNRYVAIARRDAIHGRDGATPERTNRTILKSKWHDTVRQHLRSRR